MRDRRKGFAVIHRRIQTWPLWQAMRPDQRLIWIELILAANWKASEIWTRAGRLVVQRGQVLIDQRGFAERVGSTRQKVRTVLKLLTQEGAIQLTQAFMVHGAKSTLVTIVNYDRYQDPPTQAQPKLNPIQQDPPQIPQISSPVFPSDDRGEGEQRGDEGGTLVDHDEWRRRREEALTKKYGLH